MKVRSPQLSLRLEAAPAAATRWHEGAELPFLGGRLLLKLATREQSAAAAGQVLHLSLPPGATPRQIQDAAEAWLRREATLFIDAALRRLCPGAAPRWRFSFAARGNWTEVRPDATLRLNWRLIEQPLPMIEQSLARALATLRAASPAPLPDLLGAPAFAA